LRLFYRAIELDSDFAAAHGQAAWCICRRNANRWWADRVTEASEAVRLARRPAELGKEDAVALSTAGFALAYVVGDLGDGAAFIDQALALNPNLALAWLFSGWVKIFSGKPELAINDFVHSMRLSPLDPDMYLAKIGVAMVHFCAGRYDEAVSWAETALRENANFHTPLRILAASSALSGRLEHAQNAMARLREIDPGLHVSNLREVLQVYPPTVMARYVDSLRKAGLPE
jgi:tetratricopeptide (TPR) repeat protein